jgi:hypothetical protein
MKRILLFLTIFLFPFFLTGAPKKMSSFAVGILTGRPTGVTAYLYVSPKLILAPFIGGQKVVLEGTDFKKAKSYNYFTTQFNLIWLLELVKADLLDFNMYLGPGVRLLLNNSDNSIDFGIRGPLSLGFFIKNIHLEPFIEFAPAFSVNNLSPTGVNLDFEAGIGARFYFLYKGSKTIR